MKLILTFTACIALATAGYSASSVPPVAPPAPKVEAPKAEPDSWYKDVSLTLNAFGQYSVPMRRATDILKADYAHGKFGAGIGATLGLGEHVFVEADSIVSPVDDVRGAFVDSSSFGGGLRFPTPIYVVPAFSAGAHRNWESEDWGLYAKVALGLDLKQVKLSAFAKWVAEGQSHVKVPNHLDIGAQLGFAF